MRPLFSRDCRIECNDPSGTFAASARTATFASTCLFASILARSTPSTALWRALSSGVGAVGSKRRCVGASADLGEDGDLCFDVLVRIHLGAKHSEYRALARAQFRCWRSWFETPLCRGLGRSRRGRRPLLRRACSHPSWREALRVPRFGARSVPVLAQLVRNAVVSGPRPISARTATFASTCLFASILARSTPSTALWRALSSGVGAVGSKRRCVGASADLGEDGDLCFDVLVRIHLGAKHSEYRALARAQFRCWRSWFETPLCRGLG